MPAENSPVTTEVDFEKPGKQVSFLRVPNSHNTSAWGSILIPIAVINNGDGKTILFTGGVHGDEYEGPVALLKLARKLSADDIQGRVIIIPGLNQPALQARKRLSPIDSKDMNRVFPGDPKGTISQVLAHYVRQAILPLCDAVVDLHSGGFSLNFVPYISMHYLEDDQQRASTFAAMAAFQAPVSLIISEIGGEGLLDYECESMGKVFLCAEMAGAGMLSPAALKIAETGVRNLLIHFGLSQGEILTREKQGHPPSRTMEVPGLENYSLAPSDGVFESFIELGHWVDAGEQIGQIHFLNDITREPIPITAKRPGMIITMRGPGWIERGDCAAVVAREIQ
jgi:N-alpha-acetyl-L-2,4-diaminobutyrate deacetylase